jgi:4'-phosphopantetheinyl transferase
MVITRHDLEMTFSDYPVSLLYFNPMFVPIRLYPLDFRREEKRFKGALALVFDDRAFSANELAGEILGPSEAAYFATLHFAPRQRSYLLGRYAAKLCLSNLLPELNLRAIEITRGVFEQPLVQVRENSGFYVTISHTGSLAGALAYPIGHPVGIDIEVIDPARYETILTQLSEPEKRLIETSQTNQHQIATALWAAKEALSKALTTGLMSPIQIYNLAEFRRLDSGTWEGLFENFAQYKAKVSIGSSYAFAIVLPKRSVLCLQDDLGRVL